MTPILITFSIKYIKHNVFFIKEIIWNIHYINDIFNKVLYQRKYLKYPRPPLLLRPQPYHLFQVYYLFFCGWQAGTEYSSPVFYLFVFQNIHT